MTAILTKPIVVPEFLNGLVKLYAIGVNGQPRAVAKYTINVQTVLNKLFPGRTAQVNCCKLLGSSLFVSQSSSNSQAVLKFPGYLADPAAAITGAFNFTFDGSQGQDAYLDMAFDAAGNMYVAEDKKIVRYTGTGAATPPNGASSNNYTGKVVLGNAGAASFFANLAFDAAGNLWVSDYDNNRLVVFGAAGLAQTNSGNFHVLPNVAGPLAVANTDPTLKATNASFLLTSPEGLDFDAAGNLWVGNNNDGGNATGAQNATFTTLVQITPALQAAVLATAAGGTLAAGQVVPNTNCFIFNVPNGSNGRPQFGGLQVDRAGNRLYVNEEKDGKGRAYNLWTIAATPAAVADSILAITSTDPGNGGLSMLQLGPYIADVGTDQGFEPDPAAVPWESPSISVRQKPFLGSGLPPSQDPIGGRINQLYVRIDNFSKTATAGIEVLNTYWASAALGLKWPAPWDGTLGLGGTIELKTAIPVIPGSGSVVVGPIAWSTPNPASLPGGGSHFCLLARIVTPGFHDPAIADPRGLSSDGMSFAEGSDIVANTQANARVGWKNVAVLPAGTVPQSVRAPVVLANFETTTMHASVHVAVVDARGKVVPHPKGRLTAKPGPGTRAAFAHSSIGQRGEEGHEVALPEGTMGVTGITLAPEHRVALEFGYRPEPPMEDYALRISQTATEGHAERLIGGCTFVRGKVAGLRVDPPDAERRYPPPGHTRA